MIKVDVVIIGAGAAGCFSAIQAATHFPNAKVLILERSNKALSKVKISGGGRCNVTNVLSEPSELSKNYPRGERFLKKAFYQFSSNDMKAWLEKRNVPLRLYEDGCYFPLSNDSQTIIDCFLSEMQQLGVKIAFNQRVEKVEKENDHWKINTPTDTYLAKSVIYSIGGQPKISGFNNILETGVQLVEPLPSLFTFNMPNESVKELMGIVVENASVKIAGEKWSSTGPLLITHWGMSGPAVLKASAFGARILALKDYKATILVNWSGETDIQEVVQALQVQLTSNKFIVNVPMFQIKSRLWDFLITKAGIQNTVRWSELGTKQFNKLVEVIFNDNYQMEGKTTFKEEFVTAGGIDLNEVNVQTMELKRFSGLFVAGEAMDIDGVTGGFNFQSAWTTAFIAGKNVLAR